MAHTFTKEKTTAAKVTSLVDDLLPGRPTVKFIYAHHPNSWEHVPGYGFLPRLKKHSIQAGVNGTQRGPRGIHSLLTNLRADGWFPIDDQGPVMVTDPDSGDIVEDSGYLLKWRGAKGAIYQDAWAEPTIIGTGSQRRCDWNSQYDRAGFLAWREWLRDNDRVPAIQPGVASELVKLKERRANRRTSEGHDGNPHVQAIVLEEHQQLEALRKDAIGVGARVRGKKRKTKRKGRPTKVTADAS